MELHFMLLKFRHWCAVSWQKHPAGHLRTAIFLLNHNENILLCSFSSPLEVPPCAFTKIHCCSLPRLPERSSFCPTKFLQPGTDNASGLIWLNLLHCHATWQMLLVQVEWCKAFANRKNSCQLSLLWYQTCIVLEQANKKAYEAYSRSNGKPT